MKKNEYLKLQQEVARYNQAYEDGEPLISDYDYDQMMLQLKQAEKEHPRWRTAASPTQKAGAPVRRKQGVTVTHDVPMLSIEDVFTKEDVTAWVRTVQAKYPDALFSVEQKVDGLSMSIRYENGRMTLAETRGDGYIGEDVTLNAAVIPDVKTELPEDPGAFEVRGEVYLSHEDFERINRQQELSGGKLFANPRNCAAGTLRQLDPEMTRERGLSFMVFNIQRAENAALTGSHTEGLAYLRDTLGMKTVPGEQCRTEEEILRAIDRIGELRGELDYDIDGAVVKIDRLSVREEFPSGSKYSPGHIAYKYPPEEKETVVREIEVSVGMTGRLNPTAVFDPVHLCGTTVTRATLHNQDFIDRLGIGIGDTVIVYKSGEIIPKIRASVPEKRPEGTVTFRLPDRCPSCGGAVTREADASDMCCTNPSCPAQLERRLIHFAGREAMDIKGIGTENIRALIADGHLKDVADIYRLREVRDRLVEDGVIGREKNTDKLLDAIEASKQQDPERLLTGLAIPNVGRASARVLIKAFRSVDALMQADEEALTQVPDIGGITAQGIVAYFADPRNQNLIGKLKAAGLKMETDAAEEIPQVLSGRTYVVTGDVHIFANRAELGAYIEARGGKLAGSVSKKTYALINNDASSASGKNKKAGELGIPILTEEDFLADVPGETRAQPDLKV